jgi:hypothetical protein
MKRLFSLALAISVLAISLLPTNVSAATNVSGSIDDNTVWDKTSSPYILTGNILIKDNASLTIEPGVTVDLSQYYIQVNGTLNSRGRAEENIAFSTSYFRDAHIDFLSPSKNWNEQTGSGSIIENAAFNKVYLNISSSAKISSNAFNGTTNSPIFLTGGNPSISDNQFTVTGSGLSVTGGSPII